MVIRGETWGKMTDWDFETGICTLLYIEWITNKDLLYSTGNSIQYSVVAYMGKESEKRMDICVCACVCVRVVRTCKIYCINNFQVCNTIL